MIDDFLAQATPETKLKLIRDEQAQGKLVGILSLSDLAAVAAGDRAAAAGVGLPASAT